MAAKMPEIVYACEVCGQEGFSDEDLRSHMLSDHIEGTSCCPFCDLSNVSMDEMVIHVNSMHLDYLSPQDEVTDAFMVTNGFGDLVSDSPEFQRRSSDCDFCIPVITTDDDELNANVSSSSQNCDSESSSTHGSPSRAHLSLNLNQKDSHCLLPSPINVRQGHWLKQCPLCNFKNSSPVKLEEHINRAHFDLTSPSFPIASSDEDMITYGCPLCVKQFESGPDLELHVNMDHRDILSPAKSSAVTPVDDRSESGMCPVCSRSGFTTHSDLAHHIDAHFSRKASLVTPEGGGWESRLATDLEKQEKEVRKMREQQEFSLLRAQYGMDNEGNFSQQSLTNMQRAVYAGEMSVADYYERQIELKLAEKSGLDDRRSATKGLLGPIQAISESSSNIKSTYLCTAVDHYASTYGDKGWGCGYRNIQMLLSSLQHHTGYYDRLFFAPDAMPSISQIQSLIEKAWQTGFDLQGCDQLGGKLSNTRKWIGTTEVVTLLSFFRIRCQLLDFHRPTGPGGTHPELFSWCLDHFSKSSEFIPPLYLQHQGHSRTIIGVELMANDGSIRLLVLDPSHSPAQMACLLSAATSAAAAIHLFHKPLSSMKAKQYQMVVVRGLMETEKEFQMSKVIQSTKIPKD